LINGWPRNEQTKLQTAAWGRGSKRRHVLYGKLGAASACRRIDPETGQVIGIMRAKYDRLTRDKRANG